jgi:hypothetical protein
MIRKALIIYCDNTESGFLNGPSVDNTNLRNYLMSHCGGDWYENEIRSLNNPTIQQVKNAVNLMINSDYTFVVFSGHGWINVDEDFTQYLEVADGDISINELITDADRQTILIDSCRGFLSPITESFNKGLSGTIRAYSSTISTRTLFDSLVLKAEEGISVMFSASENQSSVDSIKGGAYIYSLLSVCRNWFVNNKTENYLSIKNAHNLAIPFMETKFVTKQKPVMNSEKRLRYFPFAVKFTTIVK